MMGSKLATILLIFVPIIRVKSQAVVIPVSYSNSGSPYQQNFDGLPNTGTFTLIGKGPFNLSGGPFNAINLSGWQIFMTGGTNSNAQFAVGAGTSTGNAVYSLGSAGNTERALGSLSSSSGIYTMGLILTNNTGSLLNNFTISFAAEQWRKGGSGIKNTWPFHYKTGMITNLDQTDLKDDSSLNFSSTMNSFSGSSLNGNMTENRQTISRTITGFQWKFGEQLLLRWDDADEAGSDDVVGIDNFTFSATLLSSVPKILSTDYHTVSSNSAIV